MDSICQGFDGYQPKATPSRTIRSAVRRAQNIEHDTDGSGNIRSCSRRVALSVSFALWYVKIYPDLHVGLEAELRVMAWSLMCVKHHRLLSVPERSWFLTGFRTNALQEEGHVWGIVGWEVLYLNHLQQWDPGKIHFMFPREAPFLCQKKD